MTDSILKKYHFPKDLKKLEASEQLRLAKEIRDELIQICHNCGGHLASNLGVVELTIALHTVLSSPSDKIVWDVSHQCYAHKILTGRHDQMMSLRKDNGLSGFTKINESKHDAFGAGHASTALSAALGIAHARDLLEQDHKVCAIIGDATLSGGMTFEALNNMEKLKSNFICILNDNDMAISKPVGAMAEYMTKIRTTSIYAKTKKNIEKIVSKIPRYGPTLHRRIERLVEGIREIMLDVKEEVIFEKFGFRYLGPLDGHNLPLLISALQYAKAYQGPIMIHIVTKKGKGHLPAENNPIDYHGVSVKKKQSKQQSQDKIQTYSQVFGNEVINIAKKHPDVVVITPAMTEGSGLREYAKKFPDRFFDVGIAEEHAVTFAAGLAAGGLKPIVSIYSTFLQRGYDQVLHDVCLQNLPVVFAIDRAGLVGEDGPTHHGTFDYSFLLPIPNLSILAPKDSEELSAMLNWSVKQNHAVSIRYPRGAVPPLNLTVNPIIKTGVSELIFENASPKKEDKWMYDVVLVGIGSTVLTAMDAAQQLKAEGVSSAVINLRFVKPLDKEILTHFSQTSKHVIVIEEGSAIGGVYTYILQQLNDQNKPLNHWHQIALPDEFAPHGKTETLKEKYNLTATGIITTIKTMLAGQNKSKQIELSAYQFQHTA